MELKYLEIILRQSQDVTDFKLNHFDFSSLRRLHS